MHLIAQILFYHTADFSTVFEQIMCNLNETGLCFLTRFQIIFQWICFFTHYLLADSNECTSGNFQCDANAGCSNYVGSYLCTCQKGYTGDGKTCQGKNVTKQVSFKLKT